MTKPEKIYLHNEKLKLSNEGFLSLFFLGVGSAFSKKHYQTNLLIIKGGSSILVDCGTGCSLAFHRYGSSITEVENLLITHSHADHIGGLEEVALMGRYFKRRKPKMIVTEEYRDTLWESSLKGGCAYNERHDGKYLTFDALFELHHPTLISSTPRPLYNYDLNDLNIKLFRTMHIPDSASSWEDSFFSYGLLIDERIIFTSDTRYDPELIHFLLERYPGIEYIFHDCQLFTGGVHASYEELQNFPREIRKMMFLSHYGDNFHNFHPRSQHFAGFARQGCYYKFD